MGLVGRHLEIEIRAWREGGGDEEMGRKSKIVEREPR